jgi:hypothetical protein
MKKKKESQKVQIEFDEEHLYTLVHALEAYSRLRSGQIGMALDAVYWDKDLDWNDKKDLETTVRSIVFKHEIISESSNMSYGVGCSEMKDGTDAFIIRKVIDQYLHYKRNDGYRKIMDVSGDGAYGSGYKGTPPPKIVNFDPSKTFPVPKKYWNALDFLFEKKDYSAMWEYIDKAFKKKKLPKGNSSEIKKVDNNWVVIVKEPYIMNS